MARHAGLSRLPILAVGLVAFPLAALLGAACGGSDVIDAPPDGAAPDGLAPDRSSPDAPVPEASVADGAALDASGSDAAVVDSGSPDAHEDAEADSGRSDADAGELDAGSSSDAHVNSSVADAESPDAEAGLDAEPDVEAGLDAEAGIDAGEDSGTATLMQSLGTAGPFVVLGGATVTNSGVSTVLIGDVGTTGPAITGLTGHPFQPSGLTVVGIAATQPVLNLGTAYVALAGRPCGTTLTGQDLGGMTLAPGVYCFTSTANQIAGTTLTFDAKGDPNAVSIIQVGTSLTVNNDASSKVIGGPPELACRIFWAMGAAATINGGSHYIGNMLASTQTSMLTDATLVPGRAFGVTAGVTLLSNTVNASLCH